MLGILTLRHTKRRVLFLTIAGILAASTIPFLPSSYSSRMDTIRDYKSDSSASTRIEVWKWTWNYAKENPLGGGFSAYLQNNIRYKAVKVENNGAQSQQQDTLIQDKARAYHSAYFEMLGEQGFPGLFLWLLIQVGGLVRMEIVQRRNKQTKSEADKWIGPMATALQHGQIIYMVGALFVGIAFQPFMLMMIAMQIGLDSYSTRRRSEARWRPLTNRKAALTL